jgi:cyclopropane-fatty-acyl-phospholipid synthase
LLECHPLIAVMFGRPLSPQRAAEILQRLFGHLAGGFAFRLWDGAAVTFGHGPPVCTAVIHHPDTFTRLVRDPSPLNFAEAYVDGAIDIEGDLFEAMTIANAVEEIRVPFGDRLKIAWALWRG